MNQGKVYTSFYDIPNQQGYRQPFEPGFRFSRTEIVHITISVGALTVAFAFALSPYPPLSHLTYVLFNLPLSFLAIATAFVCHELAHKYVGQKYGYQSEFRMFAQGLLFALLLGVFFGVVFAAPGAVQIYGSPSKEESGKMAAAGPATNLLIAAICYTIVLASSGVLQTIALFIVIINTILAVFNLIPFGMFDGRKIIRWNILVWVMLLLIGIVFLVLGYAPVFF